MKCPFCESEMTSGKVSVEQSTFGQVMNVVDALTDRLSPQVHYVYFRDTAGGDATHVDHSRKAYRCRGCEALVIAGKKARPKGRTKPKPVARQVPREEGSSDLNPATCPACGAPIRPEDARCPDCDIALR